MSTTKEKVLIIIPTYNEAAVIEKTIHQIFETTKNISDFDVEILIFDSASTDQTQAITHALMAQYPSQLHLQTEPSKSGLGSAYLKAMHHGIEHLNADIIMEFDADLSHQPKYIAPMLEKLKSCDVVVGSRYINGGSIPQNWGFHRKLLSRLGNYIARIVLTNKYKDLTSGFRVTRRQTLINVLPENFLSNHYAYKLHLMWLLHQHKANIQEFPIEFIDRTEGQSKLPGNSIIDSLRVIFTLRWSAIKGKEK